MIKTALLIKGAFFDHNILKSDVENQNFPLFEKLIFFWKVTNFSLKIFIMAIRVVEFSNGGYKIRKVFA